MNIKKGQRLLVRRKAEFRTPNGPTDDQERVATVKCTKNGLESVTFDDNPAEYNLRYFEIIGPPGPHPVESPDVVTDPQHYKAPGLDVECMDVIKALGLDFCTGSALKYIWRHQSKGNPLQDLKKARENLNHAIEQLEKDNRDS